MRARAYLFCDDHDVIGSDFLVVEYRRGVVVWDHVPAEMAHHDDAPRRIGFAVVDALADLHLLDPAVVGLGDLGRPDGFVERQVKGWRKRWDLVDTGRVPQMVAVADRLADTMPSVATRVSVLHNDYKIDNCQFDPADADRVRSIFDWDMATLGEPLVDLGVLLNYWPDPSDVDGARPLHVPGLEAMGLAHAGRGRRPLRRAHGDGRQRRPVVRGVRHVEDVRGPGAAVPAVRAGREHRSAHG